jgi:hypothetical protein
MHRRLLWSPNAATCLIYPATTTPVNDFPGDLVPFGAVDGRGEAYFDAGFRPGAHLGRGADWAICKRHQNDAATRCRGRARATACSRGPPQKGTTVRAAVTRNAPAGRMPHTMTLVRPQTSLCGLDVAWDAVELEIELLLPDCRNRGHRELLRPNRSA